MAETQNDPLLPGYSFNAHLVTGLTPIEAQGYLDFFIDRPLGMKGYILNLTIRGEGVINNHGEQFVCRPGDMLLFPPGKFITMAAIPTPASGITSGSTSARAPTGTSGSTGQRFLPRPAFSVRMNSGRRALASCSARSSMPGGAGRYSELLAINLLEQLLLRRMEAINESLHPPLDNQVRDACQYISDHLADSHFDIASVAQHVCLSPSRLSHLFRQQLGSASSAGGRISASAGPNCCSAPRGCRSPPLGATSASKISSIFPACLKMHRGQPERIPRGL